MKKVFTIIALVISFSGFSQSVKVLFDASQAEMAGNADWVIDADVFNLGPNSSGAMVTGSGNEANPQRYPTPAQSGITSTTSYSYWKGALSSWAIDLVKQGYSVETLPYNGQITYGVSTNAQDLSNYKIFIVDEPNIRFTAIEKTALISFVQNGGGLFMIADHNVSDRNNDGWDSPHIWNDLMTSNPFGITFDYQNFSQPTTNTATTATDPILHGVIGNVTSVQFNNGTSITINKTANSSATGLVFKTGASKTGSTQIIFAAANYGSGKVCAFGDSSPSDDGTGDTNDQLYSSYSTAVSGSHRKLLLNACIWLVSVGTAPRLAENEIQNNTTNFFTIFPNPASEKITVYSNLHANKTAHIIISSITGAEVFKKNVVSTENFILEEITVSQLPKGIFIVKLETEEGIKIQKFIKQ